MDLKSFRKISIDEELNKDIDKLYHKLKKQKTLVLKLILFIHFLIIAFFVITYFYSKKIQDKDKEILQLQHNINTLLNDIRNRFVLSWDNIKFWSRVYKIEYPEVFYSQILLETANLKSTMVVNNNNISGMQFPKKRKTVATGKDNNNYAIYNSFVDCIYDYKLWQQSTWDKYKKKFHNEQDYISFLGRYAADSTYTDKISTIVKQFKTK